jgi:hypothetical protein
MIPLRARSSLWLFAACLAFAPGRARGEAPPPYCVDLSELASKVKDCQQNSYFLAAAQKCLAKLEKEIDANQALLSAAMLLRNASTASAQSARIENNDGNLANLQSTLDDLEGQAAKARAEVLAYSHNFVYAGPITQEKAEKYHLVRFLQNFQCFSRNYKGLGQVIETINQHVADFKKAAAAAKAMQAADSAHLKNLDATTLTTAAHGRETTARAPASATVRKVPGGTPSTITGTDKKKDKLP